MLSGSHASALAQLWQWADAGHLRRLDAAFAQWLVQQDPHCHASLPYAAALLSAMEGRGHSCLTLEQLDAQLRDWQPDDADHRNTLTQLRAQLPHTPAAWQAALNSPLIAHRHGHAPTSPPPGAATALGTDDPHPPLLLHCRTQPPHTPLRLYLRRYHCYEQSVAHGLLARAQADVQHPAANGNAGAVAQALADLFEPTPAAQAPNWQKIACALALRTRLGVITGGPGTGKTYTAARLMAAALALTADPASLRIRLAAPTGKAAARLSESLQQALHTLPESVRHNTALYQALTQIPAARTVHALLGARPDTRRLRHHTGHPLALDWLIVDEASMVDLPMMAALLDALPPHAHLVLLGDKDQLDSVEAGAVLGDLCLHAAQGRYSDDTAQYIRHSTGETLCERFVEAPIAPAPALSQAITMLRQSRRFGGVIGQLASAVQSDDTAAMAGILATLQRTEAPQRNVYWKEPATLRDAARSAWGIPERDGGATGYAALAQVLRQAPQWPSGTDSATDPIPATAAPWPATPQQAAWQATHAAWVRQVLATLARFRILCATRGGDWGVSGMNTLVLQLLQRAGLPVRQQGWFAGRVVMVARNDTNLGVFNGDVGIALPSARQRQQLRVYFADAGYPDAGYAEAGAAEAGNAAHATTGLRSIAVSRMQHVETAFAMTVHKSQGSEFEHVLLTLPDYAGPLLTRELLYTGLTRAKTHLSYLSPSIGTWQRAMGQRTQRASGLAALLHDNSDN